MSAQILTRQSSYWDILDSEGLKRIHFLGKEEFNFVESEIVSYTITDDHQLLINYKFDWIDLYISSPALNAESLVDELKLEWEPYCGSWRSSYDYLTDTDPIRMLREGSGLLVRAPAPLANTAAELIEKNGIKFTLLRSGHTPRPKKVLLADDSYVVATDFKVEFRAA